MLSTTKLMAGLVNDPEVRHPHNDGWGRITTAVYCCYTCADFRVPSTLTKQYQLQGSYFSSILRLRRSCC